MYIIYIYIFIYSNSTISRGSIVYTFLYSVYFFIHCAYCNTHCHTAPATEGGIDELTNQKTLVSCYSVSN